jgi:hypothetical protein
MNLNLECSECKKLIALYGNRNTNTQMLKIDDPTMNDEKLSCIVHS